MKIKLAASAAVLLSFAAAHATYVFTTVDAPGSTNSQVFGINDTGQVVVADDGIGEIYQAGTFSPLPALPGYQISPLAINNAGTIVGGATDSANVEHGFVYSGGSYNLFDMPGSNQTEARAINQNGFSVVGYYTDSVTGNSYGFGYNPATTVSTIINPPGSVFTIAQGVNTANQIVGSGNNGTGDYGFLVQDGIFNTFQINGGITAARGINDTGLITGWTCQVAGGCGTSGMQAFVGTSSGYQLLSAPGAVSTYGEAINNLGQVAGSYTDALGNSHGFIATPATLPVGTTSGGAYTFSVAVVPNAPIFIDPLVAVGYLYQTGAGDPNFASVAAPIGIGDNIYTLTTCGGAPITITGGEIYDFASGGVNCFEITGIEPSAWLDPTNPEAFVTELTFAGAGNFTGTMTPLTQYVPAVDEPESAGLMLGAVVAGLFLRRRRRTTASSKSRS
jgi:MYXO-CTERM domain-containing protein